MPDDDPPELGLREGEGLDHRDCEERGPCPLAELPDQPHALWLRLWSELRQLQWLLPQRPSLNARDFPAHVALISILRVCMTYTEPLAKIRTATILRNIFRFFLM